MNIPLGTDPATAYRLAMQDNRTVTLSAMMSVWNAIDPEVHHGLEDLPEDMRHEKGIVTSKEQHDPLRLTQDEIIKESFRLSALRKSPDSEGWHCFTNITRVASRLGAERVFGRKDEGAGFSRMLREHLMFETRMDGHTLEVRPRIDEAMSVPALEPVTTFIKCPGDPVERRLADQPDFGSAFRSLLAIDTTLAAPGTRVIFHRGDEAIVATFERKRTWVTNSDERLKRTHPSDPVRFSYRYGNLVGAHIGYVTVSKRGRIFANVGRPIDSPGDDDAFVHGIEQQEFESKAEAFEALRERGDLDRIFTATNDYTSVSGLYLSQMKDDEA